MDAGGLWECAGQTPRWARFYWTNSGRPMKASETVGGVLSWRTSPLTPARRRIAE